MKSLVAMLASAVKAMAKRRNVIAVSLPNPKRSVRCRNDSTPIAAGVDFAVLAPDGRLREVTGFFARTA